jgi:lipid II:glycine glycyltransferase (peptidoglycan interpeptide bridge formation enzyme)
MSLDLRTEVIVEKNTWEQFLASRPEANFLQSWNWGQFHQKIGKKTFAIGLFDNNTQVGAAMVVKEEAKRGKYLTVAGGPLLDWKNAAHLEKIFTALKELAETEQCQFIRIRPQEVDSPELRSSVEKYGMIESPMHLTADLTLQLDLTKSEDDLLAEMRKNTRYEVRRAEKIGVEVTQSDNPEEIRAFYDHQLVLAKKHSFVPFSYDFLHEQFVTFAQDHQAQLFHSYHEGKLLASAFILFYHQEAVYHYGISTPENDRLPGSYACQWAAIRWAKANGGLKYNFWGIAPEEQTNHRFAGVSLFKRGFGGQEVQYLPAHDLPVQSSYHMVRGFELIRKKLRRL